jgi:hypothetical protein
MAKAIQAAVVRKIREAAADGEATIAGTGLRKVLVGMQQPVYATPICRRPMDDWPVKAVAMSGLPSSLPQLRSP